MGKRIAILGSTGSIGTNTLDVIEHLGPPYQVVALSAHSQSDKLLEQVHRFKPAAVAITHVGQCASRCIPKGELGEFVKSFTWCGWGYPCLTLMRKLHMAYCTSYAPMSVSGPPLSDDRIRGIRDRLRRAFG